VAPPGTAYRTSDIAKVTQLLKSQPWRSFSEDQEIADTGLRGAIPVQDEILFSVLAVLRTVLPYWCGVGPGSTRTRSAQRAKARPRLEHAVPTGTH
jgi:hypothetical protein